MSEKGLLGIINKILKFPLKIAQIKLLQFHKDKELADLIAVVQKDKRSYVWPAETAQIILCIRATQKIGGDIAEVGVYKGGSAKVLCELKGEKALHLFDTFEGLPEGTEKDEATLSVHQYSEELQSVKNYLEKYKNVFFYPGLFPATATPVNYKKFSFVHLDVDLYKPTLDSLEFFYSRMNTGGIILSHDYSTLKGVRSAFSEFFAHKPESVLELSTTQCLVIKG